MSVAPDQPRLYHITHVDNLPGILAAIGLRSDAKMVAAGGPAAAVGMSTIKQRRLALAVKCHPGDMVGEYVPFYFCPRSVMLYVLHKGNHPGLSYTGGQGPMLHLEADLGAVVAWADANGVRWAFTLSNAGATYTEFRKELVYLAEVDWDAVANDNFREASVKEGKQAEFLLWDFFPWHLVQRVGVSHTSVQTKVMGILANASHRPPVEVRAQWYF